MGRILGLLVLGIVALFVFAGDLGGEVVTLRTADTVGVMHDTSVWVVDDGGRLWVRAGSPKAGWYERIQVKPEVELVRGGETRRYTAVPVEGSRERINALMAERYGWADRLIGLVRSRDQAVAIRLDPRS